MGPAEVNRAAEDDGAARPRCQPGMPARNGGSHRRVGLRVRETSFGFGAAGTAARRELRARAAAVIGESAGL